MAFGESLRMRAINPSFGRTLCSGPGSTMVNRETVERQEKERAAFAARKRSKREPAPQFQAAHLELAAMAKEEVQAFRTRKRMWKVGLHDGTRRVCPPMNIAVRKMFEGLEAVSNYLGAP